MDHKDIISTLNDLVETCKDGEYGFRTTAEHAKNPELQRICTMRAEECRQAAGELQTIIRQHGGSADDGGSASGAVHRGWVAVKSKLSGYSDLALLEETERGEDVALERYRKALDKPLPPEIRAVVERQYEGAKRNHNQVRALRDGERRMAGT